jgi:plasmid stabilization system protein ParE
MMANGFRVELAQSAEDDLLSIVAWYTSQQVPEVGRRLVAAVVERIGQLALFPDSGRIVPEFDTPWLRELEMRPYRIVYCGDAAVVTVVRVWRSERLMDPDLDENA